MPVRDYVYEDNKVGNLAYKWASIPLVRVLAWLDRKDKMSWTNAFVSLPPILGMMQPGASSSYSLTSLSR